MVNEHLLLEFISIMKDFLNSENACCERAGYVDTVVRTLEEICNIQPEDYSSKYFCRNCGWVGNIPESKARNEVYLVEECEGEAGKVFFCPRCKAFKISLREG